MTLHQLRIFEAVARLRSFTRAAEALGISQPSVSIQVGDLERSLGARLFAQEGRRTELTEAGRALYERARRILALADEAAAAVRAAAAGPGDDAGRGPGDAAREGGGGVRDAGDAAREGGEFEVIDHTSEVGIVARGRTLPELFANAAKGMMAFLIDPGAVRAAQTRRVAVEADDRDGLLVAWLNELLVLLNGEGFVPAAFHVDRLTETALEAEVLGEPVDPERHRFRLDVKAATYHGLEIREDGGWRARVIFDV